MAGPYKVYYIPSGTAVLVLTCIGVHEVPVKGVSYELIVKTDVVETHGAGSGNAHHPVYPAYEIILNQAAVLYGLRRYAGYKAGAGVRKVVRGEFAVKDLGRPYGVQIRVCPLRRKLGNPVI